MSDSRKPGPSGAPKGQGRLSDSLQKKLTGPTFREVRAAHSLVLHRAKDCPFDFTHPVLAEIIINHLACLRQDHWIKVAGFMIFPDRLELVATPPHPQLMHDIARNIAESTSRAMNQMAKGHTAVWDEHFEERPIRDQTDLKDALEKLREQSRQKLDDAHSLWLWSSFHDLHAGLSDPDFFPAGGEPPQGR
ncbi:MAG: hypothetical protein JO317_07775 [Verrucomicrobiae bacterium]|nr:hypothetical protein [Verrucomicrobiae bacterium]